MYRGSQPTLGADHPPLPAAMLALDMNRPLEVSSRSSTSQSLAPYSPYPRCTGPLSRPEAPTQDQDQDQRTHELGGTSRNVHQLPSLRTLLEPELLDNKPSEPRLRSSAASLDRKSSRHDTSSPSLKRRHESEAFNSEPHANHAMTSYSRLPTQANSSFYGEQQSLKYRPSESTPSSRHDDLFRQSGFGHASLHDMTISMQRSIPKSALSEHIRGLDSRYSHDDVADATRPVRRRTEFSGRAPVRSSRCIGQREIPGEGLCFVYEDGSFCRAIIDGEPVNPSWGITKAGKPRKRLAQACLTCREKKIKCEPGYPKCHQCAKSQRACRGGLNQPSMSNASGETSPSPSSTLFRSHSAEFITPVTSYDKPRAFEDQRESAIAIEAWNGGSPIKNRGYDPSSSTAARGMSVHSVESDWSGSLANVGLDDSRHGTREEHLAIQWEQDPYEADPRLTMHLLNLYFCHAGRATYGIFPQRAFEFWVEHSRVKTQDHLMLLYSVLAMGSVFSGDSNYRVLGKRFAAIAAYGTEKRFGKFTLQLCQSRLMLALYNFARGKVQEAWDFCGAGLRALSALKLNTEDGIKELADISPESDYGFDRPTFEECCRRTFWSGFLMDRYNGFCGGTLCVISIDDTFLRLPCTEASYEACNPTETPYFDMNLFSPRSSPATSLGHMAYLTLISAVWGEVLTFTSRAVHRPDDTYERSYEHFYTLTHGRLEAWRSMLPSNLQYNQQNLDTSIVEGYAGTFVSLHALYHTAMIRLHRHCRIRGLPSDRVARNVAASFRAASDFLNMMHSLAPANRQRRLSPNTGNGFFFSTPFPGYALMLSVDVLSSAGTIHTLPALMDMVNTTISCLEELENFWVSARVQRRVVASRLRALSDLHRQEDAGAKNGMQGQFWRLHESLETAFGKNDTVYSADDRLLFGVMAELTG